MNVGWKVRDNSYGLEQLQSEQVSKEHDRKEQEGRRQTLYCSISDWFSFLWIYHSPQSLFILFLLDLAHNSSEAFSCNSHRAYGPAFGTVLGNLSPRLGDCPPTETATSLGLQSNTRKQR